MTCDEVRERLELLRDGTLAGDEMAALRAHLAACEACRRFEAEGEALGREIAALARGPKAPPAPPHARPLRHPEPPRARRRLLALGALAGALATVVLAAGIDAVLCWRAARERRESIAALEGIVERILEGGIATGEIGERTVAVTVAGRRVAAVVRVTGGPGLFEVRASIRDPAAAGAPPMEVAALCGAEGFGRTGRGEAQREDRP